MNDTLITVDTMVRAFRHLGLTFTSTCFLPTQENRPVFQVHDAGKIVLAWSPEEGFTIPANAGAAGLSLALTLLRAVKELPPEGWARSGVSSGYYTTECIEGEDRRLWSTDVPFHFSREARERYIRLFTWMNEQE